MDAVAINAPASSSNERAGANERPHFPLSVALLVRRIPSSRIRRGLRAAQFAEQTATDRPQRPVRVVRVGVDPTTSGFSVRAGCVTRMGASLPYPPKTLVDQGFPASHHRWSCLGVSHRFSFSRAPSAPRDTGACSSRSRSGAGRGSVLMRSSVGQAIARGLRPRSSRRVFNPQNQRIVTGTSGPGGGWGASYRAGKGWDGGF